MNDALQKQLINDFIVESFEGLDRFDQELLVLEKGSTSAETMNIIFRVIHSIKGTAGCIGLGRIEATAHVGETLLSLLREGKITPSAELISALLALSDALRARLRVIETTGKEGEADHHALFERLQRLQAPGAERSPPALEKVELIPAPAPVVDDPEAFGIFGQTRPPMLVATNPSPVGKPVSLPPVSTPPPVSNAESETAAQNRGSVSESAVRIEVAQLDKLMISSASWCSHAIRSSRTSPSPIPRR
jgi:two-component system chemotaxis sensor kinase CheA